MTDKEMPVAAILFFQNEAKNIPSQDYVMRNIPCEFETYNTPCCRGPTKILAKSQKNTRGGHLVFQNASKNIPRQDFLVMNISCKFEKASYNMFFVRAVTVKSLYTLPRWQCNEAKSIVSTGYNNMEIIFTRSSLLRQGVMSDQGDTVTLHINSPKQYPCQVSIF